MSARLPGAAWVPVPGHEHTGSMLGGSAPWRAIIHTTEGGTLASNLGTYHDGWFPHFTVDIAGRSIWQHLDLDEFATAVDHQSSWPFETNRLNAVQCEVVGFAASIADLSDADLDWFGSAYMAPLTAIKPIALVAPTFIAYPQSYGTGAPCRMSPDEWLRFNGFCGHEHVPWNVHGDPGALRIERSLARALSVKGTTISTVPPSTSNEDEDMDIEQPKRTKDPNRPAVASLIKGFKAVILHNGASVHGDQPTRYGYRLWAVPTSADIEGWRATADGFQVTDTLGRGYAGHWS